MTSRAAILALTAAASVRGAGFMDQGCATSQSGPWALDGSRMLTQCDDHICGVQAPTVLDLNMCLGNDQGKLVARQNGNYSDTCTECKVSNDLKSLICTCADVSKGVARISEFDMRADNTIYNWYGYLSCFGAHDEQAARHDFSRCGATAPVAGVRDPLSCDSCVSTPVVAVGDQRNQAIQKEQIGQQDLASQQKQASQQQKQTGQQQKQAVQRDQVGQQDQASQQDQVGQKNQVGQQDQTSQKDQAGQKKQSSQQKQTGQQQKQTGQQQKQTGQQQKQTGQQKREIQQDQVSQLDKISQNDQTSQKDQAGQQKQSSQQDQTVQKDQIGQQSQVGKTATMAGGRRAIVRPQWKTPAAVVVDPIQPPAAEKAQGVSAVQQVQTTQKGEDIVKTQQEPRGVVTMPQVKAPTVNGETQGSFFARRFSNRVQDKTPLETTQAGLAEQIQAGPAEAQDQAMASQMMASQMMASQMMASQMMASQMMASQMMNSVEHAAHMHGMKSPSPVRSSSTAGQMKSNPSLVDDGYIAGFRGEFPRPVMDQRQVVDAQEVSTGQYQGVDASAMMMAPRGTRLGGGPVEGMGPAVQIVDDRQ